MGQFGQRLLGASGRVGAGRTTRAQAHSDLELAELAGWAFFPHGALVGYPVGRFRVGKFGTVCAGQSGLIVASPSPLPLEEKLADEHHEF